MTSLTPSSQHSGPPLTALHLCLLCKMSRQTSVKVTLLFVLLSAAMLCVQPSAVPENKAQAAGGEDCQKWKFRNYLNINFVSQVSITITTNLVTR